LIFYALMYGDFVYAYYRKRENAEKEMRRLDELTYKFKDNPKIDARPYYIRIIETAD
jgi:hypothetical protein